MQITTPQFKQNARAAMANSNLQQSLGLLQHNFIQRRANAAEALPEFEALRDNAKAIKNHVLQHLDLYLERFEANVQKAGGHVHWAANSGEACKMVLEICRQRGAKTVTKGKSMITEEIGLNDFLQKNNIEAVETDLGEYIIQLRGEHPSHIIAPAVHLTIDQVREDFRRVHTQFPADRSLDDPQSLLREARAVLRDKFLSADVGITGANFLIAETGTSVIVTNEGNGDLTQSLPKVHVVLASIEKIVPTLEDMSQIMRVLARSATGQEISVYTTFSTGARRAGDPDGPEEYHVILLDNGRSDVLGTEFQDMLRCIRCGACMNHCPVYQAIGGHAYGWVYPGPIGSVLTPMLIGVKDGAQLPNASTFCGRCEAVCPMRIPLPRMMRSWRAREFERHLTPRQQRYFLSLWAFVAKRPQLFRISQRFAAKALSLLGGTKNRIGSLPLAGGWTMYRDMPAAEGKSFLDEWQRRTSSKAGGRHD